MADTSVGAVLFDVDGTIIDSKEYLLEALNRALEDLGEGRVGRSMFEIAKKEELGTLEYYSKNILKKPEKKVLLYSHFIKHYLSLLENEVQLIDSAEKTFRVLSEKKIKTGILTTQYRIMLEVILTRFGLKPDATITREEVRRKKPAPDQVFALCEKLSVRPFQTLVVGDWTGDMKAGKAAGAKTAGVLSGISSEEELKEAGADFIVPDIGSIPEILKLI